MTKVAPFILDSKPQERLFDALAGAFSSDYRVDRVIQRGSFAKQQHDRASDIDMLIVLQDDAMEPFLRQLDDTIGNCCKLIAPRGWIDSIVPDFGGIGFVYLVIYKQRLIQLDVYVTAASWSRRIDEFSEKTVIYTRDGYVPRYSRDPAPKKASQEYIAASDQEYQIIFEFLLLVVMQVKHIYRARPTLAIKYRYAVIESLAVFLRHVFTPERIDYKMYDWENDFRDVRSPAVKAFEGMLHTIHTYSMNETLALMQVFKTVLYEHCAKGKYYEFRPLIEVVEAYSKALLSPDYGYHSKKLQTSQA